MVVFCLLLKFQTELFPLYPNSVETERFVYFLTVERVDQTREALSNAEPYVIPFRKIFRDAGVPEDLIWIALIESSFRPSPTSPTGAQGMFQFKEDTARAFGLVIERDRDDRNAPLLAARAAARYLRYLKNKFHSWDLVLAAYNLGEGDIRRAMTARQIDSWERLKPYVRRQTQEYVGKIRAAAMVGNAHFERLWRNKPQPRMMTHYQVRKGDTLFSIAKHFQVDLAELKKVNALKSNTIYIGQTLEIP